MSQKPNDMSEEELDKMIAEQLANAPEWYARSVAYQKDKGVKRARQGTVHKVILEPRPKPKRHY